MAPFSPPHVVLIAKYCHTIYMNTQLSIKAIAIDLDGTLLTTQQKITDATINTLRYAMDKGIRVVIATGRSLDSAISFVEQVGTTFPLICYNGSCIHDHTTKQDIYHATMDADICAELINIAKTTDAHLHAFLNHELYVLEKSSHAKSIESTTNRIRKIIDFDRVGPVRFTKAMFVGEKSANELIRKHLQAKFGDRLYMVYSHDNYFEIMTGGVTKGSSLKYLLDMYSITADETMAFGDAENDREMLAWARYGVAMGNAFDNVKLVAPLKTGHNDEDGVATKIQKMLDRVGL